MPRPTVLSRIRERRALSKSLDLGSLTESQLRYMELKARDTLEIIGDFGAAVGVLLPLQSIAE